MVERPIRDIFGFAEIDGEVGVEVEMEASTSPPEESKSWAKLHDGSLRGDYTAEYIFRTPLKAEESFKAIDELKEMIEVHKTEMVDTVRAGVHVHINVREMSAVELWTFITCYYILEELLTNWCGEGRQGNHFCLRAIDTEVVIDIAVSSITRNDLAELGGDRVRYAALNYNALRKFGSLEFRQLRTPKDLDKIKVWISILLSIKENSSLFPNPRAVVENFSLGGEDAFLAALLGDNAKLFLNQKGKMQILRRGVRVAQEIAYAKEW